LFLRARDACAPLTEVAPRTRAEPFDAIELDVATLFGIERQVAFRGRTDRVCELEGGTDSGERPASLQFGSSHRCHRSRGDVRPIC
jgi:hypothetical protein